MKMSSAQLLNNIYHTYKRTLCTLVVLVFVSSNVSAQVSSSDIFQLTERILSGIKQVRELENIETQVKIPEVQSNKSSLHVYAKSLEVRTKLIYLQKQYELDTLKSIEIPLREIDPQDVFNTVKELLDAVVEIKQKVGITKEIETPFYPDRTPANVYENLWQASYYLDALVGSISPDLVYRNVLYAIQDTKALAKEFKIELYTSRVMLIKNATPKQPNIEGFKNLYRLARLERKLKMKAVAVRGFPATEITPSDVFDTTNNILAELARIKVKSGVMSGHQLIELTRGKSASDVFVQMKILGKYLEKLEKKI